MGRSKIELWGRVLRQPELRATPTGRQVLRLAVDCGSAGSEVRLEVVMSGERAPELALALKAGQQIHVTGSLRTAAVRTKSGIRESRLEVVASTIAPLDQPGVG